MRLDPEFIKYLAGKVWRKPTKVDLWNTSMLLNALCKEVPEVAEALHENRKQG